MNTEHRNYAEDLPEVARPFAAAMLAGGTDAPLNSAQMAVVAQFHPERVRQVHEAFAIHLWLIQQEHPDAKAAAEMQLQVVERAGLLPAAWQAFAHVRAIAASIAALQAAAKPGSPTLH